MSQTGILIPVTGPLVVVEYATPVDLGKIIGIDGPTAESMVFWDAPGQFMLAAHHLHVATPEEHNARASVLASFMAPRRVYKDTCYVAGERLMHLGIDLRDLDENHEQVLKGLYDAFGRGPRKTWAAPIP